MENLVQDLTTRSKRVLEMVRYNRPAQLGALGVYLLLWFLFSTGLTTLWVAVGAGLGWLVGQSHKPEQD